MSRWKQIEAAQAILDRETGAEHKDHGGRLSVALAYPNSYYVGMSSLALQILYRLFNDRPDVVCERVFFDQAAAEADQPLIALESQADVASFDVWAFTVSFEMDYFNIVQMFRQAGVPALAAERAEQPEEHWPLLIAGGPGITMNPEPMAPFFDAIVIGEAEEVMGPLLDALRAYPRDQRTTLLDALERIPGVYVPERMTPCAGGPTIERLWVADLARCEPVSTLRTPDTEFAGMHLIEVARGCGRGCRYCLAGYVYRPPREQSAERILAWARAALADAQPGARHGGPAETPGIGLVSAAVSDHSHIDEVANELMAMGARISVSSMRVDPISVPLVRALAASGTQTLTIAPEAGTERLRRVINKPQSETDLLAAVELAQELGFPQLKMYYMIGHPTEDDGDIDGIIDLTLRARSLFRRRITINATPFVPKAHTPFERVAMTPVKILQDRQNRLARGLRKYHVDVKADSPHWAEVQAVLARGDRRLAPVLLATAQQPSRLTPRGFLSALAEAGLSAADFSGARSADEFLPWDVVDGGVDAAYLRREARLAAENRPGHHCLPSTTHCVACGACRERERAEPVAVLA